MLLEYIVYSEYPITIIIIMMITFPSNWWDFDQEIISIRALYPIKYIFFKKAAILICIIFQLNFIQLS